MAKIVPKQHGSAHFPGMEGSSREGEYWTGLLSVGYSVADTTIAINTEPTVAEMKVAPNTVPATQTQMCHGPVVHSLGQEPAMVFIQPRNTSVVGANIVFITADNSAVFALAYSAANSSTGGAGPSGQGLGVRVIAIAP